MQEQLSNQYLTFLLDGERYAVGVGQVREVLEHTKITKLPRTEPYMKGIIHLRGAGVPVIDLRSRFGLPEQAVTKDTSIVVLEVRGGQLILGALADAVQEVIELEAEEIEPAPRFGTRLDSAFIRGIGRRDGGFVVVLDIDRVFDDREVAELSETEAGRP